MKSILLSLSLLMISNLGFAANNDDTELEGTWQVSCANGNPISRLKFQGHTVEWMIQNYNDQECKVKSETSTNIGTFEIVVDEGKIAGVKKLNALFDDKGKKAPLFTIFKLENGVLLFGEPADREDHRPVELMENFEYKKVE